MSSERFVGWEEWPNVVCTDKEPLIYRDRKCVDRQILPDLVI